MRPSGEYVFPGLSSPLIVDSDMGLDLQEGNSKYLDSLTILDEEILASAPSPDHHIDAKQPGLDHGSGSSASAIATSTIPPSKLSQGANTPLFRGTSRLKRQSRPLSLSPASSLHDSSSDSSRGHKRKSSSSSSSSGRAVVKVAMLEDADMQDWKGDDISIARDEPLFPIYNPSNFAPLAAPSNEAPPDYGISNKAMETHFDFDSAASSPSPPASGIAELGDVLSPYSQKSPSSAQLNGRFAPANSYFSQKPPTTFPLGASRETSPLSNMAAGQELPSGAFLDASLPLQNAALECGNASMLRNSSRNPSWAPSFGPSQPQTPLLPTKQLDSSASRPATLPLEPLVMEQSIVPILTIHPTPLKSRVETQIPIKMSLFPMPPGVTKLHLPCHTISKPKLLAKPPMEKASDTLELHTMLVCTSAMQKPDNLQRAFKRAAGIESKTEEHHRPSPNSGASSDSSDDDESKPSNGAEVQICSGCINRERKRAARKKAKKVGDEELWNRDEHKRVVVFNTTEIKEWHPPTDIAIEVSADRPLPIIPEGAMQVDMPMRIACYCRHQGEKMGFQVIFTLKDHEDKVIAQAITSSIMITDDHKTHSHKDEQSLPGHGLSSSFSESSQPSNNFDAPQAAAQFDPVHVPDATAYRPNQGFDVSQHMMGGNPFRLSQSTSELQALQNSYQRQYHDTHSTFSPSQPGSSTVSTTPTPRNLSRQASPSVSMGPSAKKRKSSSTSKVPSALTMTRLETAPTLNMASAGVPGTHIPSHPFSPGIPQYFSSAEQNFIPLPPTIPQNFYQPPPTPSSSENAYFTTSNRSQSLDNLPIHQIFSAPTSTHPSRSASPTGLSRHNANVYQAQVVQAVANGLYGMPMGLNPHNPPIINKLIPHEGPRAGGIEVTCLGSNFCQGLEVMFGDTIATTTTWWGERSLVCLLPPRVQAGAVSVTFRHQHQHQQIHAYQSPALPKSQVLFTYIDDDEQQLLRMALQVLGHKMTGRMEDVRDLARRIVDPSGQNPWGSSMGGSAPSGGSQYRQASSIDPSILGTLDVEAALLKCLDLIDLDDSTHQPRLNLRRSSGQTMLHLGSSLGMHRFVAGLLARGANPDPRDKGGYTPMHFAALHNHSQIVRRLLLNGADPSTRTLQGYTPSDLSTSREVLKATRRIEHHTRSRSGPIRQSRNRANSGSSLRSLWESSPSRLALPDISSLKISALEDADEDSKPDEDDDQVVEVPYLLPSRKGSVSQLTLPISTSDRASIANTLTTGEAPAAASLIAWRNQLSLHFQNIQQNLPNLPNLPQMPTLPPLPNLPNLPDYQTYLNPQPMVRRISSLVPRQSRPNTATGEPKDGDYRWWELFATSSAPPPSYEEIFPKSEDFDLDVKKQSAAQASADAIADQKCAAAFDSVTELTANASKSTVAAVEPQQLQVGRRHITREQQELLRAAHAKKIKKIKSDRNLFFIWIPILVIIVVAMLKNRVPELWRQGMVFLSYLKGVDDAQPAARIHEVM
ncbi:MAG: hypothetical protein M1829_003595 [Trizodia sp. TS-e1964]|nr:MAG: hypothetical protein M1829_003595 [Trizodia sp. TS-e1964]